MSQAAQTISNARGHVISTFSSIEVAMSTLIAQIYTSTTEQQVKLLGDVLEHKFFSFELKKAVFYKILGESQSPECKDFPKKKLERMQEIRNIVAHGAIEAITQDDFDDLKKLTFRHGGENYPAMGLITEYDQLREEVWHKVMMIVNMPMVTEGSSQEAIPYRDHPSNTLQS